MSRLSAYLYDRLGARFEATVLGPRRAQLLADARGSILELGAGTGANLAHYPEVHELLLTEPDPHRRRRLAARAELRHRRAEVVDARAERLPVQDASVDTVVTTLVFCSVDDPAAALAEVRRVLRPGGRLLFLEHVRSTDPGIARWQDRVTPLTRCVSGCRPNRETLGHLDAAGFDLDGVIGHRARNRLERYQPLVQGSAVVAAPRPTVVPQAAGC